LEYAERFEGNPLEHLEPLEAYEAVRWGNPATELFELEGPEPDVIGLGRLALLELERAVYQWTDQDAPYLGIGLQSNRLYAFPVGPDGGPRSLEGPFENVGEVWETHYTGPKGGEDAYWYHEHEAPYPELYENPHTGAMVIEPAEYDGGPSYVVGPEGIIG
jgi:hypothetical protein